MIEPLNNRVVVRPDEKETKTASGIVLADTTVEKPMKGTVLSGQFKGKSVFFSTYGYDEIEVDNEKLYIMQESNLLAIYNG